MPVKYRWSSKRLRGSLDDFFFFFFRGESSLRLCPLNGETVPRSLGLKILVFSAETLASQTKSKVCTEPILLVFLGKILSQITLGH